MITEEVLSAIQDISKFGKGDMLHLEIRARNFLREHGWAGQVKEDKAMIPEDMVKFLLIQQYRQQLVINQMKEQIDSLQGQVQ